MNTTGRFSDPPTPTVASKPCSDEVALAQAPVAQAAAVAVIEEEGKGELRSKKETKRDTAALKYNINKIKRRYMCECVFENRLIYN